MIANSSTSLCGKGDAKSIYPIPFTYRMPIHFYNPKMPYTNLIIWLCPIVSELHNVKEVKHKTTATLFMRYTFYFTLTWRLEKDTYERNLRATQTYITACMLARHFGATWQPLQLRYPKLSILMFFVPPITNYL